MPQPAEVLLTLDPVVRDVLERTRALQQGHFLLTSGRHSALYFQAMSLLQHPEFGAMAATAAARHFENVRIDTTFAPAVGGIVWGHLVAQCLPRARAIFAERVEGRMALRRGFTFEPGEQVLLAEDVVTTGGSVMELRGLAEAAGAQVTGLAAVLDRSGGTFVPGVPFFSWAQLAIETWPPDQCPLCREGSVAVKPGSRGLG